MTALWEQRFTELSQRIDKIILSQVHFPVATELCYREAGQALQELQAALKEYSFEAVEEEIHLYKIVLPKFFAEQEYYRLINYANRFSPDSKRDKMKFWEIQRERLTKFKSKHAEFVSYDEIGKGKLDVVYYTHNDTRAYPVIKGMIIARERFAAWAEEKLRALT